MLLEELDVSEFRVYAVAIDGPGGYATTAVRRALTILLLVLTLAAYAGCARHSYTVGDAAETSELKIRVGDEIRVVTTDRERISLRVKEIREDRFAGVTLRPNRKETLPADTPVEVPYAKIAMIQVTRFDKKVAGVAAVFIVALGTVVLTGVPVGLPPP
jgi:hypothetical protein